MNIQQQMDKIVHRTIEDIATMSDADPVNYRVNQAMTALDSVQCISVADMSYLTQCKQALGTAQINLGLGKRDKLLDELLARSKKHYSGKQRYEGCCGRYYHAQDSGDWTTST